MSVASPDILLDPELQAAGDVAHFWRLTHHHGLECLRATFRRHSYARHTHETYAIAAVLAGCETFYPSEALMREVAEELCGRALARAPWFPRSVIDDADLFGDLVRLHACLDLAAPGIRELERDERLVGFLAKLIGRWGDLGPAPAWAREARAIRRAREFIDGDYRQEITLDALAAVAGLSRAHLIRAFRRETGLTPHAYLTDRRFRAASRLLAQGLAPADVAASVGLFDQSHLNRVFKARMGVTPGAFRGA